VADVLSSGPESGAPSRPRRRWITPLTGVLVAAAAAYLAGHAGGGTGERPPGRVRPHQVVSPSAVQRLWATPLYRTVFDPDGRPWRDRTRNRL